MEIPAISETSGIKIISAKLTQRKPSTILTIESHNGSLHIRKSRITITGIM